MHIVMLVAAGLVLLALFAIAGLIAARGGRNFNGTWPFIIVWLAVSLGNFYVGAAHHGIPVINEIGAFLPIFGIPAICAWLWFRARSRAPS